MIQPCQLIYKTDTKELTQTAEFIVKTYFYLMYVLSYLLTAVEKGLEKNIYILLCGNKSVVYCVLFVCSLWGLSFDYIFVLYY